MGTTGRNQWLPGIKYTYIQTSYNNSKVITKWIVKLVIKALA